MKQRTTTTGPATNTYNRPWSVVDNEELANLREIAAKAKMLNRGCHCDYDYRCGNCQTILDLLELVKKK